jgi:hypothetical protein
MPLFHRQVARLFHGRVATAHHHQRLPAEPRQRSVAHRTGRDAHVLEAVFRRQPQVIRPRPRGDDDRLGLQHLTLERRHLERPLREIDIDDIVGDDPRSKVERLLPHQLHQFRTAHPMTTVRRHELPPFLGQRLFQVRPQVGYGKPGKVLDFGRQRQLPQGERPLLAILFRDGPFKQHRLETGPRDINRRRPTRRTRSDDDHALCHVTTPYAENRRCDGSLSKNAAQPHAGTALNPKFPNPKVQALKYRAPREQTKRAQPGHPPLRCCLAATGSGSDGVKPCAMLAPFRGKHADHESTRPSPKPQTQGNPSTNQDESR